MWVLQLEVLRVKPTGVEIRRGARLTEKGVIEILRALPPAVRLSPQGTDGLSGGSAVVEAIGTVRRNGTAKGKGLLFFEHLHHRKVVYTIFEGNASGHGAERELIPGPSRSV